LFDVEVNLSIKKMLTHIWIVYFYQLGYQNMDIHARAALFSIISSNWWVSLPWLYKTMFILCSFCCYKSFLCYFLKHCWIWQVISYPWTEFVSANDTIQNIDESLTTNYATMWIKCLLQPLFSKFYEKCLLYGLKVNSEFSSAC